MVLKKGCLVLVIVGLYMILLMFSGLHVPTNILLRTIPPFVIVGVLLWKSPRWTMAVVALYFIAVAVYVLFHNDIMGPMQFEISDRPFDVPAQFHRSWRYYWCMAYMHEVAWLWGIPSIILCGIVRLANIVKA